MATIDIDIAYVEKLAELLQRTGLTEIEIGQGDARVRVVRQLAQTIEVQAPAAVAAQPPPRRRRFPSSRQRASSIIRGC